MILEIGVMSLLRSDLQNGIGIRSQASSISIMARSMSSLIAVTNRQQEQDVVSITSSNSILFEQQSIVRQERRREPSFEEQLLEQFSNPRNIALLLLLMFLLFSMSPILFGVGSLFVGGAFMLRSSQLTGSVTGDPFFKHMQTGEVYEVRGFADGEDGDGDDIYNIYSDLGLQVNAKFSKSRVNPRETIMSEIGVVLNGDRIHFDINGGLPTINGQALQKGESRVLSGGLVSLSEDGKQLTLAHKEGVFTFDINQDSHIDISRLETSAELVASDGVMPHGLFGQTANPMSANRRALPGATQGQAIIEGNVMDYEVPDIFSTTDRFSRYNGNR